MTLIDFAHEHPGVSLAMFVFAAIIVHDIVAAFLNAHVLAARARRCTCAKTTSSSSETSKGASSE